MEFFELGFGTPRQIVDKINECIVIRDDDAAAAGGSPYWMAHGDVKEVIAKYEADGGTVSWAGSVAELAEQEEVQ
jgi:hypothetical protein